MKRILLATLSLTMIIGGAYAQNASIRVVQTATDISGQEHTENVLSSNRVHVVDFAVDNNTATIQNWYLKRVRLTSSIGWTDEVCWGSFSSGVGECNEAPNDEFTTSYTVPINAGDTAVINTYITAPTSGTSSFRYYLTDGGSNKIDSVDLTISKTLGVNENVSLTLSIAPNPATNYINVNAEGVNKADLKIVDVLGNVVLKETVFESSKKVDVTKYKNGIYFITVEAEGVKPITRKLIIRH